MADPADQSPPRPRGRPRADQPGTSVSSWVKPGEYDKLVKEANRREQSVSALVRSLLTARLR